MNLGRTRPRAQLVLGPGERKVGGVAEWAFTYSGDAIQALRSWEKMKRVGRGWDEVSNGGYCVAAPAPVT